MQYLIVVYDLFFFFSSNSKDMSQMISAVANKYLHYDYVLHSICLFFLSVHNREFE